MGRSWPSKYAAQQFKSEFERSYIATLGRDLRRTRNTSALSGQCAATQSHHRESSHHRCRPELCARTEAASIPRCKETLEFTVVLSASSSIQRRATAARAGDERDIVQWRRFSVDSCQENTSRRLFDGLSSISASDPDMDARF